MISRFGKTIFLLLMTVTISSGQSSEFGILSGIGVGKFHFERRGSGYYTLTEKLSSRYKESIDVGVYFRLASKFGLYLKSELAYNRFHDYQSTENQPYTVYRFYYDPFRTVELEGFIFIAEEDRLYESINFPFYIGYERSNFFLEFGYGGAMNWYTRKSYYEEISVDTELKVSESDSGENGYNFVYQLFRVSFGYNILPHLRIKVNGSQVRKNGEQEKFYKQYQIGVEYRLLKGKTKEM